MKVNCEQGVPIGDSAPGTGSPTLQVAAKPEADSQLLSELEELRQLRKLGVDTRAASLLRSLGVC